MVSPLQGKYLRTGSFLSESKARKASIQYFKQHNPTELNKYIPESPESASSQPPSPYSAPGHSRKRDHSPSTSSNDDMPLLQRFYQATRDPRRLASSYVSPPATATEQQQQQQQHQPQPQQAQELQAWPISTPQRKPRRQGGGPGRPAHPAESNRDGRYKLPPRLCKAGNQNWTRGYSARRVPSDPSSFVYEVDLRFAVRAARAQGICRLSSMRAMPWGLLENGITGSPHVVGRLACSGSVCGCFGSLAVMRTVE